MKERTGLAEDGGTFSSRRLPTRKKPGKRSMEEAREDALERVTRELGLRDFIVDEPSFHDGWDAAVAYMKREARRLARAKARAEADRDHLMQLENASRLPSSR